MGYLLLRFSLLLGTWIIFAAIDATPLLWLLTPALIVFIIAIVEELLK